MKVRNKKQSSWGRLPLIVLVCALIVSLGSAVLAAVKDVTVTMPAGRVLISQTNYPITKHHTPDIIPKAARWKAVKKPLKIWNMT